MWKRTWAQEATCLAKHKVRQGSTVVKGRSIAKCSWIDNFGTALEKVLSEISAVWHAGFNNKPDRIACRSD